jgi:hypothetical protein
MLDNSCTFFVRGVLFILFDEELLESFENFNVNLIFKELSFYHRVWDNETVFLNNLSDLSVFLFFLLTLFF